MGPRLSGPNRGPRGNGIQDAEGWKLPAVDVSIMIYIYEVSLRCAYNSYRIYTAQYKRHSARKGRFGRRNNPSLNPIPGATRGFPCLQHVGLWSLRRATDSKRRNNPIRDGWRNPTRRIIRDIIAVPGAIVLVGKLYSELYTGCPVKKGAARRLSRKKGNR